MVDESVTGAERLDRMRTSDEEIAALKQLHDNVIRPAGKIAERTGRDVSAVRRALQALSVKGFVEERPGDKWKITYDGKEFLGRGAGIAQAVRSLAEAEKGDVQSIAASQIALLTNYYQLAIDQAERSFRWALVASIVGFLFFLAAVAFVLWQRGTSAAMISLVSGALVELIAGLNFYLYGRTTAQLSLFQTRLETTQSFLLANSLCEHLEGERKQRVRSKLIGRIVRMNRTDITDGKEPVISKPRRGPTLANPERAAAEVKPSCNRSGRGL